MKKVTIVLAVIIVVLLGVLIFVAPSKAPEVTPPGGVATSTVGSGALTSSDGHVQVTAPHAQDVITSPVSITGTVTGGGWFFEASFPVKVLDANGTVLGQG